ncbi:MAG TPA: hypothetical protein VI076_06140 [Actinopolymorphaceae bacterium]
MAWTAARGVRVAAGVAIGVFLAGCGGSGTPSEVASAEPSTTSVDRPVEEAGASPTVSATASSPTPTPTPSVPTAADGRNLKACHDGTCEVELRKGDRFTLAKRFVVETVTVDSIATDEITFDLHSSASGFSLQGKNISVSSSCVNGRCESIGELTVSTKIPGRIASMKVELRRVDNGQALVVLGSK